MTEPTDHEPKLINNTSDLPLTGRELAERFMTNGDALGALQWRADQIRELLLDLASLVDGHDPRMQKEPHPPRWGQVADLAYVVARLGDAAGHLGVFTSATEMNEALGIEI